VPVQVRKWIYQWNVCHAAVKKNNLCYSTFCNLKCF
jgi:hypothetical protein